MKIKLITPSIISGIILSYLILGWSNHLITINGVPNVRLSESIGYSLFQISHVLLFTSIYLSNIIGKLNKLLLIPIIIQLIDLVPIELLQSVRFSLISTLSIIIGWITIMVHMYEINQKRVAGLILISVICLVVSSIPGFLVLTSSDNPKGELFQFGVKVFGLDSFTLHGETGNFYQYFSQTIYSAVSVFLTIELSRKK